MAQNQLPQTDAFWQEDPFHLIHSEAFPTLGIDPDDIPEGTFAATKHPSLLPSRFGGNAYGFGLYEIYDRLDPGETKLLQTISFDNPEEIKTHYKKINQVYKKLGLLIRFTKRGKPFYLLPVHLVSNTLTSVKSKVDELSKIINYHRSKYFKEFLDIGLVTQSDDLILHELAFRFKEHRFTPLDSLKKLGDFRKTLDLVVLTRDPYEILLMEKFGLVTTRESVSKKLLEQFSIYILGKVFNLLKEDGEIFIVADKYPLKTDRQIKVIFKTDFEKRNFLLFCRIFKTQKRYQINRNRLNVNAYDFQKYLSNIYVDQAELRRLWGDKDIDNMSADEIASLPHLNLKLDNDLAYDQKKVWPRLLDIHFKQIFLKPQDSTTLREKWNDGFSVSDFSPQLLLIYLGQKKPITASFEELKKDISDSTLSGCPLPFLADYKNSFSYVIRTLDVLSKIKMGDYKGLPEFFTQRLRQPFENKRQRYHSVNDVLKLISKINKLRKIESYLNPMQIEGSETDLFPNLEILPFFGFTYHELKEIFLIIVGHTAMGRILSGKMNEKALTPVCELARSLGAQESVNLLRYCRLMSMAEIIASRQTELNQEQLAELFNLYESMVRIVTNRDLNWNLLLDEEISSMGGIHNKVIRRILKMMNYFEFFDSWTELKQKGAMEKESLADYDEVKLSRIENIIRLEQIIITFEEKFLREDPLQLPIFYRRFLDKEFHGTGHLFERMDCELVFVLIWIAVNVARTEVINFNPILADISPIDIPGQVKKVEDEARLINRDYLDLDTLRQVSEQIQENKTAFIMGTGFQVRLDPQTQAINIHYIDMDKNLKDLEDLVNNLMGRGVSEIATIELEGLETLFSNLESFYQGHLRVKSRSPSGLKFPSRQNRWFEKARDLREIIKSNYYKVIFRPQNVYSDLELLYRHASTLLGFILPEFVALRDLTLTGRKYLTSPITENILNSTRKIQALIRHDRENFQDYQALHNLAKREFGPMTAGTVGLNETQIEMIEKLIEHLSQNEALFEALIKSFIFRDLGLIPGLQNKYKGSFNPADHAAAGAIFLEREGIPQRFQMDDKAKRYLTLLVKHHDLIHHMIRGEFSISSMQDIFDLKDKDLFDACFIGSFIMFSAMGEELMNEDSAKTLFQIRYLSHRIIDNKVTLEDQLNRIFINRGRLAEALEVGLSEGLPTGVSQEAFLKSYGRDDKDPDRFIETGKKLYAMERLFRLRETRYVEFNNLAAYFLKTPLQYIYKSRKFGSVGYSTFERYLFEAARIYNIVQDLPDNIKNFILYNLVGDGIRIFGFENISIFLNYENMIKVLLISLLGADDMRLGSSATICLDFIGLAEKIERRYEVVNDWLNNVTIEEIWKEKDQIRQYHRLKTGLRLNKDEKHKSLTIDFIDKLNISKRIDYMETINDEEQLKNYFHSILRSLRKSSYYTEDYELRLEQAFYLRLKQIADMMIDQSKQQIEMIKDFKEINLYYSSLMDRSLEIGFSEEQKNHLKDIYEITVDNLKREKLEEINRLIGTIQDKEELRAYWDNVKWYLMNNREFLGKEFENLIAKKFDQAVDSLS